MNHLSAKNGLFVESVKKKQFADRWVPDSNSESWAETEIKAKKVLSDHLKIDPKLTEIERSHRVIIGCIYRPPDDDVGIFNDVLSSTLELISSKGFLEWWILLGDFYIGLSLSLIYQQSLLTFLMHLTFTLLSINQLGWPSHLQLWLTSYLQIVLRIQLTQINVQFFFFSYFFIWSK